MNKFWLFFGIFLTFTGVGTIFGILIIIYLIWKDLRKNNKNDSKNNNKFTANYYDEDTLNDMR